MSQQNNTNAFDDLNLVRVVDPTMDLESISRRFYQIYEGAVNVSYENINPDGSVSNSQLTFSANPPSPDVVVDRSIYIEFEADITFRGVSAGAGIELLQASGTKTAPGVSAGTANYDAIRANPFQKSLNNCEVQLNNDRITQNINQYVRCFERYSNDNINQNIYNSMTASYPDMAQEYADLDGETLSELRSYGSQSVNGTCPRGGFTGVKILRNDSTGVDDTAIVRIRVISPLYLSPFKFSESQGQLAGLIGIQNMKITLSLGGRGNGPLAGLASSLWSHSTASPSVFNNVDVNVVNAKCLVKYYSPNETAIQVKKNYYSYYEPTLYPTQQSVSVLPDNTITISMNNVQLNSIPNRLILFVSEQDSNNDITKTDTYFSIENVSISFANRDNILANATQSQLYEIAKKNNCNLSWTQFSDKVGSVLALDFGQDICLNETLMSPGLRGNFNLRVTVNCRNLKKVAVVPTLNCLVISEGVMLIDRSTGSSGQVTRNIGVLDKQEVLDSKLEESFPYYSTGSIYGGNFLSSLRKFGQTLKKLVRPTISAAQKIVPAIAPQYSGLVGAADEVAKTFGLGLIGGKRLTRKQLARMLEN